MLFINENHKWEDGPYLLNSYDIPNFPMIRNHSIFKLLIPLIKLLSIDTLNYILKPESIYMAVNQNSPVL